MLAALSITGFLYVTAAPTSSQMTSPLVGTWAPVTITNVHADGTKTENFGAKQISFSLGGMAETTAPQTKTTRRS